MTDYEQSALAEMLEWQFRMQKRPSMTDRITKDLQGKINNWIPEKVHKAITFTIEKMVKAVLFGAEFVSGQKREQESLRVSEAFVKERIEFYRKTAVAEGAFTGAGGFFLGLADFPLLIGIKIKLLFDIASAYGYDVKDYKERLYILHIFQLAFSSREGQLLVYNQISSWETSANSLPENVSDFDWRSFQQEYRDYIDLAKMAQLIPVIGALVGAVVNYRLINKLGETAMNCYRMRKLLPKE